MKGTEQAEQGKEKASTHHRRTQPSTSGRTVTRHSFSLRPTPNCSHSLSLSPAAALSWFAFSLTHSRFFVLLSLTHALTH
jgi:hypothetical protein